MPWIFKELPKPPTLNTGGRIADKEPNSRPWQAIHDAADEHTDQMKIMVVRAVDRTRNAIDMKEMLKGLRNNDQTAVNNSVPWEIFKIEMSAVTPVLNETLNQAGGDMVHTLPKEYQDIVFFESTPRSLNWITQRAAELVVQVSDETILALRESIKMSAIAGHGVDETAKHLKNLIGLTQGQARAVTRFRDRILAAGGNIKTAEQQAAVYSKRLLAYRAENIARTELMRAANQGHLEMLYQGVDQGILAVSDIERYWIVTPDDRLCSKCLQMTGATTKLGEPFVTPSGNMEVPPLHPMCRCTTGVRFKK